jgi:hypothetical protein
LLTAQSNRFVDNSTNAQAITPSGSPSVQRLNPFTSINYYQPSVIGGSGYFDGSGDYLTAPGTSQFAFGTGDWSFECWVYPLAYGGSVAGAQFFGTTNGSATGYSINIGQDASTFRLISNATGTWADNLTVSSNSGPPLYAWSHMIVCRVGANLSIYRNGIRVATTSGATTWNFSGTTGVIGRFNDGTYIRDFNGYLSNLRVVKGSSPYDPTQSTVTVPTSPVTAITNSQLLLDYTNAAILDNAMINDLETVGSAQISTSIKKYGSASMYFDGSTSYLKGQSGPSYSLTGDFTIECWVYLTTASGTKTIFTNRTTGGAAGLAWVTQSGSAALSIYTNGGFSAASSTAITLNTWTHVALTRSGSTITQWLNGVSVATVSNSSSFTEAQCYIGANNSGTELWPGYIDDLRITKVARYTASFTPPTSQLQDQ